MKKLLFFMLLLIASMSFSQDSIYYKHSAEKLEIYQELYNFHNGRAEKLADAARSLEDKTIVYDPSYVRISYPMGDVPANTGVCTDVVIRAFRKAFDWDLQETIYKYRKAHGESTDRNIDHRRVRNLMKFFDEYFDNQKLYNQHKDKYRKGNIIIWDLGGGQLHIGICVDNNIIIHNICCGQVIEPMYMEDRVIRNYSLYPDICKQYIDCLTADLKEK